MVDPVQGNLRNWPTSKSKTGLQLPSDATSPIFDGVIILPVRSCRIGLLALALLSAWASQPLYAGCTGCVLVWSDEFDEGTVPNPDVWDHELGYGGFGWGSNEWQLYTDSPDNVRIEDGNLVIQARCDTPPCGVRDGSVTSGRIATRDRFEFRYGTVVARIKPPVGDAAWPKFWSLGANHPEIGWPRSGQIDFMAMHNAVSNERTTHFTMHWCDETVNPPAGQACFPNGWAFFTQSRESVASLGDDFHLFEAEWNEDRIIGRIDGIPYFERVIEPGTMEEFQRDFFLTLNLAMGGTLGSDNQPPTGNEVWPQTMLVDYVRVYHPDADGDGVADVIDNCSELPNPAQSDTDGDAIGNACDMDIAGNDCMVNFLDLSAVKQAFFTSSGQPQWNPDADFSGADGVPDGSVNFADLQRMKAFFFGAPGPSALPNACQ